MNIRSFKARLLAATVGIVSILTPGVAAAWKPTSHVYFAEIAVNDALDNGHVEIPILGTDQVRRYPVDARTLEALRAYRAHYRAGVLGPDAYPDILTGQQVIHPDPHESGIYDGSDAWLEYLWISFEGDAAQHAFRLGFMTHAAGDMYGHTFINTFSGAPFTLNPPDNAIRHIVLEGYIDKRLPADAMTGDFFNTSIAGLEGHIYATMVNAQPNTRLNQLLPEDSNSTRMSVPRIFSTLRANLDRGIGRYYAEKDELQRRLDECGTFDIFCKIARRAALTDYVLRNALPTTYMEYWRADIDEGLRLWPQVSHDVARALFFNPGRAADTEAADRILTDYTLKHLLSMAGLPDFAGLTATAIKVIIEAITPAALLEPIRLLKARLLDALLMSAIGMSKDELKAYLNEPQRYFDQVMTTGDGRHITLQQFNSEFLKISDPGYQNPAESFDWRQLPASYNTVVATKLVLLSPDQINQLMRDLGDGAHTLERPNVMLGFAHTLDGSRQWRDGMVLAANCDVYTKVFKPLPGDESGC